MFYLFIYLVVSLGVVCVGAARNFAGRRGVGSRPHTGEAVLALSFACFELIPAAVLLRFCQSARVLFARVLLEACYVRRDRLFASHGGLHTDHKGGFNIASVST